MNTVKDLARAISLVENESGGYISFLQQLLIRDVPVVGITGSPGAGKSTLTDGLIGCYVAEKKKVAVLCVDPSSPFHLGALLGDRVRMNRWYNDPNVYIRSLASRGALGGLNPKIIEITDVLRSADFDLIIVETVGVGQSESEISGLADVTVVVTVPEGGDEIQTMKAGVMEIADIFVVNKSDRPGSDIFVKNLKQMLAPAFSNHAREIPIIKTDAVKGTGLDELKASIEKLSSSGYRNDKKHILLAQKAFELIRKERMKDINIHELESEIHSLLEKGDFNLYRYLSGSHK